MRVAEEHGLGRRRSDTFEDALEVVEVGVEGHHMTASTVAAAVAPNVGDDDAEACGEERGQARLVASAMLSVAVDDDEGLGRLGRSILTHEEAAAIGSSHIPDMVGVAGGDHSPTAALEQ